ncbi:MAG TPA: divalent metal cation transporter [Candidatus Baltobacteraceae bacterium]|nr:divalent metal cation transporter [Candidatus Baltobacteraceae bacterium]
MDTADRPSNVRSDNPTRANLSIFGPGLVSAASNNDPTTVATLAVIGATTGYELCWLVVLVVPMLAVVQALAAGVGVVCKTSLQGAIRREFGLNWAIVTLCAVAAVNVMTLAADVKAGSEAISLFTHVQAGYFILPFVLVVGAMLLSHSYGKIERYLSLLPILFVCYAGSAILAHIDIKALLAGVFVPHFRVAPLYAFGALALLGTTLTSYVYIWESVEVAERRSEDASFHRFTRGAAYGMLSVGVIFVFILIASAATLGKHHQTVATANDMAAALVPLAGPWASTLFGIGLLGSAVLAVPVLAGTTAYVAAHTFGWDGSLDRSFRDAKPFYGVLLASLAVAAVAAFAPVSPVALLLWASIAGGLATPLTLAFLALIAGNRKLMGPYRMSRPLAVGAWAITGVVVAASLAFLLLSLPKFS